jgi:hypothetical protein
VFWWAVWDGQPSGGLGGTADVVAAYAREWGVPVEVVWPEGCEPRLQSFAVGGECCGYVTVLRARLLDPQWRRPKKQAGLRTAKVPPSTLSFDNVP